MTLVYLKVWLSDCFFQTILFSTASTLGILSVGNCLWNYVLPNIFKYQIILINIFFFFCIFRRVFWIGHKMVIHFSHQIWDFFDPLNIMIIYKVYSEQHTRAGTNMSFIGMLKPIIMSYKLTTCQLLYLTNTYKPREILLTILSLCSTEMITYTFTLTLIPFTLPGN